MPPGRYHRLELSEPVGDTFPQKLFQKLLEVNFATWLATVAGDACFDSAPAAFYILPYIKCDAVQYRFRDVGERIWR